MIDIDGPICDRRTCFARAKGSDTCMVLTSTDFNGRECPFFKTSETYRVDREQAQRRLSRIGYREGTKNDVPS